MAGLDEQTEELDFVAVSPESLPSAIAFFGEACASPGLLQSRIDKPKNYLERVSKEIESKQKKRLEILQKWTEADQELEVANVKQIQAKHEIVDLWWLNRLQKMQKLSIKEIQGFRITRQDPFLIKQHNKPFSQCSNPSVLSMQSMGCHGVSEQLMAAGATEDDVKKISQVMAQTVRRLETGNAAPESGPEAHSLPCEVVGSDEEEPVKRHHRKEAIGEKMQTGREGL